MTQILLIAAMGRNRVIGAAGRLPWGHLPADLANFAQVTSGCRMIMGRKSYDTPDRLGSPMGNFVITRQMELPLDPGFARVGSLPEALAHCTADPAVFVIGGSEIFQQALPLAHRIHLTLVAGIFAGDAFFPELNPDEWVLAHQRHHLADAENRFACSFLVYERRSLQGGA